MDGKEIVPADRDEVAALRQRVFELERIVDAMSGYVQGFGSNGVSKARMAAKRHLAATST